MDPDEYTDEDWQANIVAAQVGLHKTGLSSAITGMCCNKRLPGGVASCKMGEQQIDGSWKNVRVDELATTPSPGQDTIRDVFAASCTEFADQPCMGHREITSLRLDGPRKFEKAILGPYKWLTYAQAFQRAENFSRGLALLGMKKGENISFFADTKLEWQLGAQACFMRGYVVATVYANLGVEALEYGLNQTEVEIVMTDAALVGTVNDVLDKCPNVKHVIFTKDPRPASSEVHISNDEVVRRITKLGVEVHSFEEVEEMGRKSEQSMRAVRLSPDDLAVIMYTSGSTGMPKGVMISHRNIVAALSGIMPGIPTPTGNLVGDYYVAYLPLAHILELSAEIGILSRGGAIGYGSTKTITDASVMIDTGKCRGDAPELAPTIMAAVPLIMDKIRAGVTKKVGASAVLSKLFGAAYAAKAAALAKGETTPHWDKLLFDMLRTKLLGGRLRYMLSGGGPLSKETQDFMNIVFCCPVGQGYGLTETCGGATLVWPCDRTAGRVGSPILCCEIKLVNWEEGGYYADPRTAPAEHAHQNSRGEVLLGGAHISLGYYKNPEKTAESYIRDANGKMWFYTGDIGEFHPDGVLQIIDRKKDLVKLSGGEYVSYGKIEPVVKDSALVENAMLYCDSFHQHCIALVTKPLGTDPSNADVLKDVQRICKARGFAKFEIPAKIFVVEEQWGPDNDLCTAALKLKRNNIVKHYKEFLTENYA